MNARGIPTVAYQVLHLFPEVGYTPGRVPSPPVRSDRGGVPQVGYPPAGVPPAKNQLFTELRPMGMFKMTLEWWSLGLLIFCTWYINYNRNLKFLEDTSAFYGVTDTPVLDFWWRLPWVSKPVWIPFFACFLAWGKNLVQCALLYPVNFLAGWHNRRHFLLKTQPSIQRIKRSQLFGLRTHLHQLSVSMQSQHCNDVCNIPLIE